ncbi:MAG TPA: NAD(P)-binding domain-containing protein, partial [Nitrososphaeraceae archaeon]|nr:NAD(P)-binding domain-containing protein [Nitrososphaeraceae archaeon]
MSRSPSNNKSLTIQQYDPFQDGYKQPDFDRWIPFDKVLVIGLGQLGLPVATYVKDRGFDVYGYDISTRALERAEKTAGIKKAINFSGFDVYIICVST